MTTSQQASARRGGWLIRLLATLVFVAGGFAAEMVHPVQCSLVSVKRLRLTPRKE
jgi:hypothetical protein